MRAALIYQRATQEAVERIARGLSDLADRHRAQGKDNDEDPDDGATGSLVPTGCGHAVGTTDKWVTERRRPSSDVDTI
jgi:hypothetical protein